MPTVVGRWQEFTERVDREGWAPQERAVTPLRGKRPVSRVWRIPI
jgi:hypothetical protein